MDLWCWLDMKSDWIGLGSARLGWVGDLSEGCGMGMYLIGIRHGNAGRAS